MLTLTLNGNHIPLPHNFSMHLTINSPVCDFEKIPFSYSIDFTLPVNRHISAILGKPERVAKLRSGNDQKFTGFEVRFAGSLFIAGTLTVSTSGNSYNCTLTDLVGELSEKEQERSILDIPKFNEDLIWENKANYDPENHQYCCFPVSNPEFFKDKGVVVKRTVYENGPSGLKPTKETYETEVLSFCFNKTAGNKVNALNSGYIKTTDSNIDLTRLAEKYNTYSTGSVTVVSPFFYLKNIITESLKANQLHLVESILNSSLVYRNICIYNNFDITESDYLFADSGLYYLTYEEHGDTAISNIDLTKSVGTKINSYVRTYQNKKIRIKNHLPKISIGELLVSTQNLINVCFDFLPNRTVKCFWREDLITRPAINIDKYFTGEWFPVEKKSIALKFVREHDQYDQVFKTRYTDLSDRIDDIKDPVSSWADLQNIVQPKEGDIRKITSTGTFVEFRLITQVESDPQTKEEITRDVLGWEEISIGLQDGWYEYGREETEEIKTRWSTCYGDASNTLVNQPGDQEFWKSKQESFSPRLLIYKGLNLGGNQTANFSFEYEGTNGIIEKCWKQTARWWANRLSLEGYFNFSANALRSIIWNKCLPYRTRETAFMIQKIDVDLFIDRIGPAKLTVFKRE